jgi:hypothetical protein
MQAAALWCTGFLLWYTIFGALEREGASQDRGPRACGKRARGESGAVRSAKRMRFDVLRKRTRGSDPMQDSGPGACGKRARGESGATEDCALLSAMRTMTIDVTMA